MRKEWAAWHQRRVSPAAHCLSLRATFRTQCSATMPCSASGCIPIPHRQLNYCLRSTMRENLEYWVVVSVARCLGRLPRGLARLLAWLIAVGVFWCFGRLRRVGERNLQMALPELTPETRTKILRGVFIHLGWQLVEFCRMQRYTQQNLGKWMRTEGLEHYLA